MKFDYYTWGFKKSLFSRAPIGTFSFIQLQVAFIALEKCEKQYNAICLKLFWYEVFVHWKLKLLNLLTNFILKFSPWHLPWYGNKPRFILNVVKHWCSRLLFRDFLIILICIWRRRPRWDRLLRGSPFVHFNSFAWHLRQYDHVVSATSPLKRENVTPKTASGK